MTVSREVQATIDKIHETRDYEKARREADKLKDQKMADLQARVDAIPVDEPLSQDDKDALAAAVGELDEVMGKLSSAVPANTAGPQGAQSSNRRGQSGENHEPPVRQEGKPDPMPGTGDPEGAAATAPLMPNLAFNPDPTGQRGVGDAGQPNQSPAIETAGGFVVAGGGATARAVGSRPESPSSSLIVPANPDATAAATTADEAKSGLGDSSQNATIGSDGQRATPAAEQQEQANSGLMSPERRQELADQAEQNAETVKRQNEENDRARQEAAARGQAGAGGAPAPSGGPDDAGSSQGNEAPRNPS